MYYYCVVEDLSKVDVVGLYFSAHWCPPCRNFTPIFAKNYDDAKKAVAAGGASVEVVFVSSDQDQDSFDEYHKSMPWAALDFKERDIKAKLSEKFGVRGIPSLVFLDGKTGELLTKSGRGLVTSHPTTFPTKALGAKKAIAEAKAKVKDLSILDDGNVDMKTVRAAETIVVVFGSNANRGWLQYVKPKFEEVCAAIAKDPALSAKTQILYVSCDSGSGDDGDNKSDGWTCLKPRHNIELFGAALADGGSIEPPHILVLNGKGDVLVEDAARDCYNTGFDGFPWTPAGLADAARKKEDHMKKLRKEMVNLGALASAKIVDGNGKTVSVDGADIVALYFSAHWCGPCRAFTPQLAGYYKELRAAGKKFEIVFVSSDKDNASFQSYFAEMPWKALDFAHRDLKTKLSEMYEVEGIPTLVLLKPDGSLISTDGRSLVSAGADAFPWTPEAIAASKKRVVEKEAADAKAQLAAGKVVLKRHRGAPGTSKLDTKTNTMDFRAFDTFAGDASTQAVKSGKVFYEITAVSVSQGIAQAGWADAKFAATTSPSGSGVGDDKHSWGFDGNRVRKWGDEKEASFGSSWRDGDVLGCAIDLDAKKVLFGLNGDWTSPFGVAFDNVEVDGGIVPAITAQGNNYKLSANFGNSGSFKHGPPDASFKAFATAV
eukprot:g4723.t1